jgi:hypothetical protein
MLNGPGREEEWGSEYGPDIMTRFMTANAPGRRLYFMAEDTQPNYRTSRPRKLLLATFKYSS